MNKKTICPCCEGYYFKIQDNDEICPICSWQDDLLQRENADRIGGANRLSLNQYRQRWLDKQLLQELSQAEASCTNQIPLEIATVLGKIKERLTVNI